MGSIHFTALFLLSSFVSALSFAADYDPNRDIEVSAERLFAKCQQDFTGSLKLFVFRDSESVVLYKTSRYLSEGNCIDHQYQLNALFESVSLSQKGERTVIYKRGDSPLEDFTAEPAILDPRNLSVSCERISNTVTMNLIVKKGDKFVYSSSGYIFDRICLSDANSIRSRIQTASSQSTFFQIQHTDTPRSDLKASELPISRF